MTTNVSMIIHVDRTECIAELRCLKPNGEEHKRYYACERFPADSVHRAELKAILAGLRAIKCPARVMIYIGTAHSVAAINQGWFRNWKENDWKNAKGNLVRDWEIWKYICEIAEAKGITMAAGAIHDWHEKGEKHAVYIGVPDRNHI